MRNFYERYLQTVCLMVGFSPFWWQLGFFSSRGGIYLDIGPFAISAHWGT